MKTRKLSSYATDAQFVNALWEKHKEEIEKGYREYTEGMNTRGVIITRPPSAERAFKNELFTRLTGETFFTGDNPHGKGMTKEQIKARAAAKTKKSSATARRMAAQTTLNSRIFSSWEYSEGRGIVLKLKEHGKYEEFRSIIGKTNKIDYSKFEYDKSQRMYIYTYTRWNKSAKWVDPSTGRKRTGMSEERKVGIWFTKSPEVIHLIEL